MRPFLVAAQGITVTNTQALINGRAAFCPPADYVLNVSEMNRLADTPPGPFSV
jgi:hypothetical protein